METSAKICMSGKRLGGGQAAFLNVIQHMISVPRLNGTCHASDSHSLEQPLYYAVAMMIQPRLEESCSALGLHLAQRIRRSILVRDAGAPVSASLKPEPNHCAFTVHDDTFHLVIYITLQHCLSSHQSDLRVLHLLGKACF